MKFLFDENLSPQLPRLLSDIFPDAVHVRNIGMQAAKDPYIWNYAKENSMIIVSKDSDMHDLSLVFGMPPKVIRVRLGNCSTAEVVNLLRTDFNVIKMFAQDDEVSLLVLP